MAYDVWGRLHLQARPCRRRFSLLHTTPLCPLSLFPLHSFHFWRGLYYRATAVKSMNRQELCISSFTAPNLIRLLQILVPNVQIDSEPLTAENSHVWHLNIIRSQRMITEHHYRLISEAALHRSSQFSALQIPDSTITCQEHTAIV